MARKILILFAHPSQRRSEVNLPMLRTARGIEDVTIVDLYAEYPRFKIDVDREQERLLAHDVIIFQHPLYWYSTPAILKEWQDLVLEYGFAYGSNGTKLSGKVFLSAITAGGPDQAYHQAGSNNFEIRTLMSPIEQTANLCGMIYLPPFALFSSRTAAEDGTITRHLAQWRDLLIGLRDETLELSGLRDLPVLNNALSQQEQR